MARASGSWLGRAHEALLTRVRVRRQGRPAGALPESGAVRVLRPSLLPCVPDWIHLHTLPVTGSTSTKCTSSALNGLPVVW